MIIIFKILAFIAAVLSTPFHDYHVSNCNIKYNSSTKSVQISLHVFIDDLEDALRLKGINELHILTEKESEDSDYYIEEYIQDHFMIKIDGQCVVLDFLGKEGSGDYMAVWCYFEIHNIRQPASIEITNTIFLELFDDQKNIVSIKRDQLRKGFLLLHHKRQKDKVSLL